MKKEDGSYLKLPFRGVLTALKVRSSRSLLLLTPSFPHSQVVDSLQEWRVDFLLKIVVAEMTVRLLPSSPSPLTSI
jgi:hypothetical protein